MYAFSNVQIYTVGFLESVNGTGVKPVSEHKPQNDGRILAKVSVSSLQIVIYGSAKITPLFLISS